MATYTIRIVNNSGQSKSYVAFMETPQIAASGGDPVIYTNAWATFESVTDGSWDSIVYTDNTYAWWGVESGAAKGQATAGGVMAVNTQTCDSVSFIGGAEPGFDGVPRPGSAPDGAYQIVSGGGFGPKEGYAFGLARPSGQPTPAPVATFTALPDTTFDITPVERFYVTEGSYTPGQVIEPAAIDAVIATIDFTGTPYGTATATQAPSGDWTVSYSS